MKYHPKPKVLGQLMKKLQRLLYPNKAVNKVSTPPPIFSYCSARKISSYIVRAKLYALEIKVGCYNCGNHVILFVKTSKKVILFPVQLQESLFRLISP